MRQREEGGRGGDTATAVAPTGAGPVAPVGVVVVTRDRRTALLATLRRLESLPERPPVVVVDNGSYDGTADAVRSAHPDAEVVRLPRPTGPSARTVGARALDTPLVALSDDDSWWEPGALSRAAALFEAHERLGLIAARVLVHPGARLDPTSAAMACSPLPPAPDLPGRRVLGFVACGALVRRDALLDAGGFRDRFGFGGEEALLSLDLAAAGWGLAYVPEIVAHHAPETRGERPERAAREARNAVWTAWLRRPARSALHATLRAARRATSDHAARRGLAEAAGGARWALRERRVVSSDVEADLRRLESDPTTPRRP